MEAYSFSFLWTLWVSSDLTLWRSETASWVSLKSTSSFLFSFSTSCLIFFSRSSASSASSKACSSLLLTLDRWLHRSSNVWISSSVFCLFSPTFFFSLFNFETMSVWWAISSLSKTIWSSLVFLSSSAAANLLSIALISSANCDFWELIFCCDVWIDSFCVFSAAMRRFTSSACFWTSWAIFSTLTALSMISWTADPPLWSAKTNSFFSVSNLVLVISTFFLSSRALSMWASAIAIFFSYSSL